MISLENKVYSASCANVLLCCFMKQLRECVREVLTKNYNCDKISKLKCYCGSMAEHLTRNEKVVSSILTSSSKNKLMKINDENTARMCGVFVFFELFIVLRR